MIIVIKIGTNSILDPQGVISSEKVEALVEEIAQVKRDGCKVILVSSGAVGAGRSLYPIPKSKESVEAKQMLASLGQPELMTIYSRCFKRHNLIPGQVLLTSSDFKNRRSSINIAKLFDTFFNFSTVVPVVNENDSTSVLELMFTDNDEIAGLLAALVNAEKLIILTNTDGIYKDYQSGSKEIWRELDPERGLPEISEEKSSMGRGGMASKLKVSGKLAANGVGVHIANIDEKQVIKRIINGESIGTYIKPMKRKSGVKRWLALAPNRERGRLFVNKELSALLKRRVDATSILPIGVERVEGIFKKGDLILLFDEKGEIGSGVARYSSDRLLSYLGEKGNPPIVHWNYLHIN